METPIFITGYEETRNGIEEGSSGWRRSNENDDDDDGCPPRRVGVLFILNHRGISDIASKVFIIVVVRRVM